MTLRDTRTRVVYGYVIEVVLVCLLLTMIYVMGSFNKVSSFLENSAGTWATFFGLMLAAAAAARQPLFNVNNTDFGSWLEWKNVGGVYAQLFLFNLVLYTALFLSCLFLTSVKGTWFTRIVVAGALLGVVNAITFPVEVYHLSRLQARFNHEYRKALEAEKRLERR